MAIDVGSAIGYLILNSDGWNKGFADAWEELQKFNDKTATALDKVNAVGGAMTSVGTSMTKNLTLPIINLGKKIVDLGAEFESAMSKVEAISGATAEEMESLNDKAIEMGAITVYSAKEAADAFGYMAMAGWDAEAMMSGIAGVMNLAAASGEDLATTSDIVTDALTAFGLTSADTERFVDVLAAAATSSNTNVSMMGETFKYVAPLAGALGYSVEDMAVAIGLMANNGIKGSQAGTTFRSALTKLISPTEEAYYLMESLGLANDSVVTAMVNADGTMKPFSETLELLKGAFANLSEAEQTGAASTLFGQQAMSGMLALINTSQGDIDALTTAINDSSGAAEAMASIMLDNTSGALETLSGALESLAIKLSSALLPIVTDVANKIAEWVDWFTELDSGTQATILTIAAIVAAIGPVIVIIGNLISTVAGIVTAIKTISAAMSALNAIMAANPIGLIITAIGLLVAAFIYLWNNCEPFKEFWINLWEKVKEVVSKAVDGIKSAWDAAVEFFTVTIPNAFNEFKNTVVDIFNSVVTFFQELPGKIKDFLLEIISNIKEWATNLKDSAVQAGQNFINSIVEFFTDLPYKVGYFIGEALGKIILWATEMKDKAIEAGQNFLNAIIEFFTELPGNVWNFLKETWNKVTAWASDMWGKAKEVGSNFINTIIDFFKELPGKIGDFLTNAFETFASWVLHMARKALEVGTNIIDAIVTFFKELPGKIGHFLSETWSNFTTWASDMWNKAKEAAENIFNAVVDGLKELPNKIFQIGKDIITGLWDGVASMIDWVKEKIGGFFTGIVDGVKSILDSHSPSKVYARIGSDSALGYGNGFVEKMAPTKKRIVSEVQDAVNEVGEVEIINPFSEIVEETENMVESSLDNMDKMWDSTGDNFQALLSVVESAVKTTSKLTAATAQFENQFITMAGGVTVALADLAEYYDEVLGGFLLPDGTMLLESTGAGYMADPDNFGMAIKNPDYQEGYVNVSDRTLGDTAAGDVYIITTSAPLDPVETARQIELTKVGVADE